MKSELVSVDDQQILDLLREFSLTKYESLVYLSLLKNGPASAKQLKEAAGIPYGKIYEVIESLSDKGYIFILPETPIKCIPTQPKHIITNLKEKFNKKITMMERCLNIVKNGEKETNEQETNVAIIKNPVILKEKLKQLITKGEEVILIRSDNEEHQRVLLLLNGAKVKEKIFPAVDFTLLIAKNFFMITEFRNGKMLSTLFNNSQVANFLIGLVK